MKLVEKKNGPWRFKTLFGFLQILSLLLLQEEKFENSVFITLNEFSEAVIYPYQIYHHHYTKTMAMSFISLKCDWNFYPWYHWDVLLSTNFCELEPDYWQFFSRKFKAFSVKLSKASQSLKWFSDVSDWYMNSEQESSLMWNACFYAVIS